MTKNIMKNSKYSNYSKELKNKFKPALLDALSLVVAEACL